MSNNLSMNDSISKRFWVATRPNGEKDIVWNWEANMHGGIYPEYASFDGPYETRAAAEYAASAQRARKII